MDFLLATAKGESWPPESETSTDDDVETEEEEIIDETDLSEESKQSETEPDNVSSNEDDNPTSSEAGKISDGNEDLGKEGINLEDEVGSS
jgi:hypothetical protein